MVNGPRRREGDQLLIRFPAGSDIRARLAQAAEANKRSLSSEVVHRLEFSLAVDVTVHETGYDVEHGLGTPEWNAAMLRRKPNDASGTPLTERVAALEERVIALEAKLK